MSSPLCCRCHRNLLRGGTPLDINSYTTSLNNSVALNPDAPFILPMGVADSTKLPSLVTETAPWDPYMAAEEPFPCAMSDSNLTWNHLLRTELLLPFSGPTSLSPMSLINNYPLSLELGTGMGGGALSATGGCALDPYSTSENALGPTVAQYCYPVSLINAASSLSPSTSSSPTPLCPIYDDCTMASTSLTRAPLSGSPAGPSPVTYSCLERGCRKVFIKLGSLRQHERTHTRPEVCSHYVRDDGTPMRFASKKCLCRHTASKHPGMAGAGEKRYFVSCPLPGCHYKQREDNVSRHHRRVHGVRIRWKKGVPIPAL
ncbi:hypothetical protein B0T14DRAFT_248921 [Immersiella caudata]|uniref:C2H2-type domain-containing protein n=1 Tax=Immersiella caudata TaxID=314043 RepID=A0AA39WJJ4_9PEZI|nr:hypothetical protein B0T14DRAFT_248921 [Immersiella caudata]